LAADAVEVGAAVGVREAFAVGETAGVGGVVVNVGVVEGGIAAAEVADRFAFAPPSPWIRKAQTSGSR
jgi:hypothetical protein